MIYVYDIGIIYIERRDPPIIGERIKELRQALKLTQKEFAERVGIGQSAITWYEKGEREPLPSILKNIYQEFNVNETWLRTGEGEMFRPMTRTNEIAAFVGKALKADDDIKQRVIWALSQLEESDWATINKLIDLIANKKGPD